MGFLQPEKVLAHLSLESPMTVADMGAGGGNFLPFIVSAISPAGAVYLFDLEQDLLHLAKSKLKNGSANQSQVEIICTDLTKPKSTKVKDNFFDRILVANLLFNFEPAEREVFFTEMFRILKPGGRMLVLDWAGSFGGLGPREDHLCQPADLKELSAKVGLNFLRDVPSEDYHFGFTVEKSRLTTG